jgi:hypothetical protein
MGQAAFADGNGFCGYGLLEMDGHGGRGKVDDGLDAVGQARGTLQPRG